MTDNPTNGPACSLGARALQERVAWIAEINQQYLRRTERQGNTLTLAYDAAALPKIQEMVAREQNCCSFLEFEVINAGDEVQLKIVVPVGVVGDADVFLAPFQGNAGTTDASECCPVCTVGPADPVKANGATGAAMATSATAVVACAACCALPLAFPAVAASAAGGVLAWLGGAHLWVTGLAVLIVAAAWLWIWRQTVKRRARAATSTLALMGLASLTVAMAVAWPAIEPKLLATMST